MRWDQDFVWENVHKVNQPSNGYVKVCQLKYLHEIKLNHIFYECGKRGSK